MVKDAGSKFCYSVSPKIRQTLLHWGYESTEKDFLLTQQINVQKGVITSLTVRNLVKSKTKI